MYFYRMQTGELCTLFDYPKAAKDTKDTKDTIFGPVLKTVRREIEKDDA